MWLSNVRCNAMSPHPPLCPSLRRSSASNGFTECRIASLCSDSQCLGGIRVRTNAFHIIFCIIDTNGKSENQLVVRKGEQLHCVLCSLSALPFVVSLLLYKWTAFNSQIVCTTTLEFAHAQLFGMNQTSKTLHRHFHRHRQTLMGPCNAYYAVAALWNVVHTCNCRDHINGAQIFPSNETISIILMFSSTKVRLQFRIVQMWQHGCCRCECVCVLSTDMQRVCPIKCEETFAILHVFIYRKTSISCKYKCLLGSWAVKCFEELKKLVPM